MRSGGRPSRCSKQIRPGILLQFFAVNTPMIRQLRAAMLLSMGLFVSSGDGARSPAQEAGAGPAKAALPAPASTRFRKLAPGVEQVIPAEKGKDGQMIEVVSRHDLVELLAGDPQFGERPGTEGKSPAKNVAFAQKVWTLKFAFKPVRFIQVDVPDGEGRA